jgi:IclR family acetate operon transcriptional repressor
MATGKLLLAYQPPGDQERLLGRLELCQFAPRTITDLGELRRDLKATRQRGYAISDEEGVEGIVAFAAPVASPDGRTAAALGVAAPKVRVSSDHAAQLRRAVQEAAEEIARRWAGGGR